MERKIYLLRPSRRGVSGAVRMKAHEARKTAAAAQRGQTTKDDGLPYGWFGTAPVLQAVLREDFFGIGESVFGVDGGFHLFI
jgi:hypothetical protein